LLLSTHIRLRQQEVEQDLSRRRVPLLDGQAMVSFDLSMEAQKKHWGASTEFKVYIQLGRDAVDVKRCLSSRMI
jgi:hypothetical protein